MPCISAAKNSSPSSLSLSFENFDRRRKPKSLTASQNTCMPFNLIPKNSFPSSMLILLFHIYIRVSCRFFFFQLYPLLSNTYLSFPFQFVLPYTIDLLAYFFLSPPNSL